jgi:hypothetical protein
MIDNVAWLVGSCLVIVGAGGAAARQTGGPVAASSRWVPFSADLRFTSPDGTEASGSKHHGRDAIDHHLGHGSFPQSRRRAGIEECFRPR